MSIETSPERSSSPTPSRPPLRLWPGVAAIALLIAARFGLKLLIPGFQSFSRGMMGGLVLGLVIILWWLFASRAAWSERLAGLGLIAGSGLAVWHFKDPSMGPHWLVGYLLPSLFFSLVAWAVLTRRVEGRGRWVTMVAAFALVSIAWLGVRTEGIDGDHDGIFAWRFSTTAEDRLLAESELPKAPLPLPESATPAAGVDIGPDPEAGGEIDPEIDTEIGAEIDAEIDAEASTAEAAETDADGAGTALAAIDDITPITPGSVPSPVAWSSFRGEHRDGRAHGPEIATDWQANPPTELWRRPVGPGWSSLAVAGDRFYTQEQRGEDEAVTAYDLDTGELLWIHRDPVRFFESNAGAGPRSTPTWHRDRLYTVGATGLVNALDARDGTAIWSRNLVDDTGAAIPDWGFSSSPLVIEDRIFVAAAGQLVAYAAADGELLFTGPEDATGYASPHRAVIHGVEQILLPAGAGTRSFDAETFELLWHHEWPGFPIVQPATAVDGNMEDGSVLVNAGEGSGIRRLEITQDSGTWAVRETWASRGLKPYFNDFVIHQGHAYGFDGRILSSIELETGERAWKGGRYGSGQLLLLADRDLLIVLAEDGDLALVDALPEGFVERARIPAIEGKTWNHPVVVADRLLVRNGAEMVAFRLAAEPADRRLAQSPSPTPRSAGASVGKLVPPATGD